MPPKVLQKFFEKFQICPKVIFEMVDIISERKNATVYYKMLHFSFLYCIFKTSMLESF